MDKSEEFISLVVEGFKNQKPSLIRRILKKKIF